MKFIIKVDFYLEKINFDKSKINKVIEKILQTEGLAQKFKIETKFYDKALNMNLHKSSHVTFFEISKGTPCVMFNSGYLFAKNANMSLLCEGEKQFDLPSVILDSDLIFCDDLSNYILTEDFKILLVKVINKEVQTFFNFQNQIEKIWYKLTPNSLIYVVGGPDNEANFEELKDSILPLNERLNDTIYNYGDKDTFIDACIFLSRYLPNPTLKRRISSDRDIKENENLLIIGGPGSDVDPGNLLCKKNMDLMKTSISYGCDEKNGYYMMVKDRKYFAEIDNKKGDVLKDYGYFACFKNPINPKTRVILINGIHTMGVLGAFLAFSDDEKAEVNYKTLLEKAISHPFEQLKIIKDEMLEFECFFEVDIIDKKPIVPIIKNENIYFFKNNNIIKKSKTGIKNKSKNPSVLTQETLLEKQNRLKTEILQLLKIAEQGATITNKKNALKYLIVRIENYKEIDKIDLVKILEICYRNKSFPDENIIEITKFFP